MKAREDYNKYRVRLMPVNDARPDQQCDGYLAWMGRIQEYTRGQAIKKARFFNGRIERVALDN